jgi:hypothetical protein
VTLLNARVGVFDVPNVQWFVTMLTSRVGVLTVLDVLLFVTALGMFAF